MTFAPGVSGNPAGRPKGTRNRVTLARQALFGTDGEEVARMLSELAGRGHWFALEALFDPVSLARFKRAARRRVPPAAGAGASAVHALEALARGTITATEATALLQAAGCLQTLAESHVRPLRAPTGEGGADGRSPHEEVP
jgi:Family of unknown function (DUF5681)